MIKSDMKAKHVHIYTNGNVAVFDENGMQMPDYQGFILEAVPKLVEICDQNTIFIVANWRTGWKEPLDVAWWFEEQSVKS